MVAIQHNVEHSNIQNDNIIDVLHESIQCIYNVRSEMAMDNGTTTGNNGEKKCDDVTKEGETIIDSKLDDTDIGQV